MARFEGVLQMQWDVAYKDFQDGGAGGAGHAYHVIRAGAGEAPPALRY
jgi:hypothetical protein